MFMNSNDLRFGMNKALKANDILLRITSADSGPGWNQDND